MDAEHQTQASRRRHTRGHLALCSCAGGPRPCPAMANSALEERRLFLHADPAAVSGSLQRHVLALRTQAGRCIICWLRSDEFASLACMLSGEQYTPVPSIVCSAHIRRQNPSHTRSQVLRALFFHHSGSAQMYTEGTRDTERTHFELSDFLYTGSAQNCTVASNEPTASCSPTGHKQSKQQE